VGGVVNTLPFQKKFAFDGVPTRRASRRNTRHVLYGVISRRYTFFDETLLLLLSGRNSRKKLAKPLNVYSLRLARPRRTSRNGAAESHFSLPSALSRTACIPLAVRDAIRRDTTRTRRKTFRTMPRQKSRWDSRRHSLARPRNISRPDSVLVVFGTHAYCFPPRPVRVVSRRD